MGKDCRNVIAMPTQCHGMAAQNTGRMRAHRPCATGPRIFLHSAGFPAMKCLPSSLLLSLALLALPAAGATAADARVSGVVQAAGLSLPDRHVAAKLAAEASLDGGAGAGCGGAVRVMAEPAGSGAPLQLGEPDAPEEIAPDTALQPAAAAEMLRELPAEVFVHRAHVAPMATPAAFNGILPMLPVLRLVPPHC